MLGLIPLAFLITSTTADFQSGMPTIGSFELPELGADVLLTVREAILQCEVHLECAGFTFRGAITLLDVEMRIGFYRYIPSLHPGSFMSWNTYMVERDSTSIYKGQIPLVGKYEEHFGTPWLLGTKMKAMMRGDNTTALALSKNGRLRVFTSLDLGSMTPDPNWTTVFNMYAPINTVTEEKGMIFRKCCPEAPSAESLPSMDHSYDSVRRVSCDVEMDVFMDQFIRPGIPVIMEGCDYEWLKEYDTSPSSVAKYYHDNTTIAQMSAETWVLPPRGFTHTTTPNSAMDIDTEVMESLAQGDLRSFNRLHRNQGCKLRAETSNCSIFEKFPQPAPIPDDLFALTKYQNDLHWVIVSSEGTGSHPHQDPDLTGAWNYMINGYKWWVIFPEGVNANDVHCDESCSVENDYVSETFRWFSHVLPVLRNMTFNGQRIVEFVQGPGEALYLPHGRVHSVLNVRDNVAVTENFLFADALPELMSAIALDAISPFRPNWDEMAAHKITYGGYASANDRRNMHEMYFDTVRKIQADPNICLGIEDEVRWKKEAAQKNNQQY